MPTATTDRIALSRISGQIEPEMVAEAPAVAPSDLAYPVIVETVGSRLEIVDGYHRTAGMLRWCEDNDADPQHVIIDVVVAIDDDLCAVAAEPGGNQDDAIRAIYAAVGLEW